MVVTFSYMTKIKKIKNNNKKKKLVKTKYYTAQPLSSGKETRQQTEPLCNA